MMNGADSSGRVLEVFKVQTHVDMQKKERKKAILLNETVVNEGGRLKRRSSEQKCHRRVILINDFPHGTHTNIGEGGIKTIRSDSLRKAI